MLGAVEAAHFQRQLSFVLRVHQLLLPVALCIFSLFEVGPSIYPIYLPCILQLLQSLL